MEAKAAPAEGRAAGRSRWTRSTGAQTAGMRGEAGIKDRGTWQTAEREERRAQAHGESRAEAGGQRMEQMGQRRLQVQEGFSEAGGRGCASWGCGGVGNVLCLHLFAISACPSFIDLSPLRASQIPAALAPSVTRWGWGRAVHTRPVHTHTHTHSIRGHHSPSNQSLLLHPDCLSPFPLPPPARGVSTSPTP